LNAFGAIPTTPTTPRRTQDRRQSPQIAASPIAHGWQRLLNEPDTDFSLPQNGEWAQQIIAKWQPLADGGAPQIPLVIAGHEIFEKRNLRDCLDPSRPGVVVGQYRQANESDINSAVECARRVDIRFICLPI